MNPDDVRRRWAERSGEFSPRYYAYYGPDETSESIRDVLDAYVGAEASVLELGCSSGRHLAHLREHGYDDLHGIEINGEAFDVMGDAYPELADEGTFYHGAIEDVVREFEDRRFDAVYSVETLQHIHPDDEWVFGELARVAGDLLVTVEIESGSGDRAGGEEDGGTTGESTGTNADGEVDASEKAADGPGADADDGAGDVAVNYVDDDVPLYYRDWNRAFVECGLDQIESRRLDRDTLRAFRVVPDPGR